jgi:hypothetical protein
MVLASMADSAQLVGMSGYRLSAPRDPAALEESVRFQKIEPLML